MALSTVTSAVTSVGSLLAVSPQQTVGYQPQQPPQANGLPSTVTPDQTILFDYEGEQQASFKSDITDHYIEDNTSIQDNIALPPVLITTHGYIGELNDIPPTQVLKVAQTIANKLTVISAYAPGLSATALLAYNEAAFLAQAAISAAAATVSALSSINGGTSVAGATLTKVLNQNRQQGMYQRFYSYWQQKTLFTVQTPWMIFKNMAIQSLVAVQDESSDSFTTFEVTFKQIRLASDLGTGAVTPEQANSNAAFVPVEQNVTPTGPPVSPPSGFSPTGMG